MYTQQAENYFEQKKKTTRINWANFCYGQLEKREKRTTQDHRLWICSEETPKFDVKSRLAKNTEEKKQERKR